jgi:3-oxoacyl-[acyl-carrier protein] reductase
MRRVIVVGGSGAVGRVVCQTLARQGVRVGLTYGTGREIADAVCREHAGAVAVRVDLASPETVAAALEGLADELGGLDGLVYAAAVGSTCEPPRFDPVEEVSLAGWNRLLSINVTSAFVAVQALAPRMTDGGNVVLLGSVDGVKSVPSPVPYAASKGALSAMTLSLAKALGEQRIRVNVIAPGVLEKGASHTLPERLRAEYLKHTGLRRLGRIEEVAEVVSFFAIENRYVTGQTIVVDGGL